MGAKYIIHTSIAATADDEGLPAQRPLSIGWMRMRTVCPQNCIVT